MRSGRWTGAAGMPAGDNDNTDNTKRLSGVAESSVSLCSE